MNEDLFNFNEIKEIWIQVLFRAINDLKWKGFNKELIRYDAEKWLLNDNNDQFGSFLFICDFLEVDPGKIRNAIFKPGFKMHSVFDKRNVRAYNQSQTRMVVNG